MTGYHSLKERWLDEHGGRTVHEDVLKDSEGEYILMGSGEGYRIKVRMPTDDELAVLYDMPRRSRP